MKRTATTLSLIAAIAICTAVIMAGIDLWPDSGSAIAVRLPAENEEEGYKKIEKKLARTEYFFRMLRDPATNSIPPNVRARELGFAERMPDRSRNPLQIRLKSGRTAALEYSWQSAGPTDIGGRTRALGIDSRDPNIIIAGGTSGGIWRSADGGMTWTLRSDPTHNLSVTSLAQDPTDPDSWYYTSGEFRGQSAADNGNRAFYYGTGIFKSVDNGLTWDKIVNTDDTDTSFNTPYDFITRIVVNPTTGTVFFASNGIGVYRVVDDNFPPDLGPTPEPALGTLAGHSYADVAVNANGDLIAVLSQSEADGDPDNTVSGANPGVFVSRNDGQSWTEVTPPGFPNVHQRSVAAFAPSAPDTAYVLTYVSGQEASEDVRLWRFDLNDGGAVQAANFSDRIPDFGGDVGYMSTQSNYNMEVAVKPDNPDFVLIGGINLFRVRDITAPAPTFDDTNKDEYWVGGYDKANDISRYPGQHPDQHVIVFDPTDPDVAWAGHDGGLSRTSDIGASSITWTNRNNGYITTQFYAAAIPPDLGDTRLMGGTQDNGTPFFRYNLQQGTTTSADDIFGGDGGYSFFTDDYLYVSRQNGDVLRWTKGSNGDPQSFAFVHPSGASNQIFIHPYAVDPNDQGIMYYPEGDSLWRNTRVDEIPQNNDPEGRSDFWEAFEALDVTSGFTISALEVSTVPSNTLYYGASAQDQVPKIFKLTGASSSTSPENISISAAASGSYVHDIAVNPANGDEVLVVISNYGVPSLYHTSDGGSSWTDVEGNLSSTSVSGDLEPSVRSAIILEAFGGKIYMVGTSTGIYSTGILDGSSTQWAQEAPNDVAFAVTNQLDVRSADGTIAAGTHGRGIFNGTLGNAGDLPFITVNPGEARAGDQISITATNFTFNTQPAQNSVTFNDVPGVVTDATTAELTVVVPRGTLPPESESSVAQIRVETNGTSVLSSIRLLPPAEFQVNQNYPNPFNPTTTIPFDLPVRSGVIVQVFDLSGRKVLEPVRQVLEPRTYNFPVDMTGLASGVYFYRVVAIPSEGGGENLIKTRKMTLIK